MIKTKPPAKNFLEQRDVGYRGTCCVRGVLHILGENAIIPAECGDETCISIGSGN